MILDATCGFKSTWFDKKNEETVFLDHRIMKPCKMPDGRNWEISPDVKAKWEFLPFRDNVFMCIYFDPPHILSKKTKNEKMVMKIKYGSLDPWRWQSIIYKAVCEFMRVLKPDGILILKWNETSKSLKNLLQCFPLNPLFGTPTQHNTRAKTWFVVFQNRKRKE